MKTLYTDKRQFIIRVRLSASQTGARVNRESIVEKTDATLPKGDRISTTCRNVRALKNTDAKFDFTPPPGAHISTPLGE